MSEAGDVRRGKRGGRRRGAGRPPLPIEQRKTLVTIRLSPQEVACCEKLGDTAQQGIHYLIQKERDSMQTFFGFAIADSMFPPECTISRMPLTLEEVRVKLVGAKMCLNPSHKPTVAAAAERFALEITVPEKPAHASLLRGDSVIVMSVRGLPRLEGRHEYTAEEIANASFVFGEWTVR